MTKMTSDYHVSTNGLVQMYLTNLSEITDFKGPTHLDPLAKPFVSNVIKKVSLPIIENRISN